MRSKEQRRSMHVSQLKTISSNSRVNTGANREQIITRGGKTHKVVKASGKKYFVELKKTR